MGESRGTGAGRAGRRTWPGDPGPSLELVLNHALELEGNLVPALERARAAARAPDLRRRIERHAAEHAAHMAAMVRALGSVGLQAYDPFPHPTRLGAELVRRVADSGDDEALASQLLAIEGFARRAYACLADLDLPDALARTAGRILAEEADHERVLLRRVLGSDPEEARAR